MKTRNLFILLLFLCIACHHASSDKQDVTGKHKFKQIDIKLNELAKKLGTTVATTGGGASFDEVTVPEDKLEMRRIVWIDDSIGKAIIIKQNFENRNIDAPDWDFLNFAWLKDGSSLEKGSPFWQKFLLKKARFEKMDSSIDQLLQQSLDNLKAVKKTDLGYDHDEYR
jgi:hypothetical protein